MASNIKALREGIKEEWRDFLEEVIQRRGDETLRTASNEIAVPVVDGDGGEQAHTVLRAQHCSILLLHFDRLKTLQTGHNPFYENFYRLNQISYFSPFEHLAHYYVMTGLYKILHSKKIKIPKGSGSYFIMNFLSVS